MQQIVDETELDIVGDEAEIVRLLLSPEAIRITGRYLEKMYEERKDLYNFDEQGTI